MELWYQFPDLRKRLGWLGLLRITLLSSSSCLAPFVLVNMLTLPHAGLSWNLPSCFRALSVRVCCALAHIYVT